MLAAQPPSRSLVVDQLQLPSSSRAFFSSCWSPTPRTNTGRALPSISSICCFLCAWTSRAQRLRRRASQGRPSDSKSFFDDWSSWLEEDFVAKLDLIEERLPPQFARRKGIAPAGASTSARTAATIESRVWSGQGPEAPVRRVRYVTVDAGPQLQAFNAVVYPAPDRGLQPVLGVDVLSFNSHKRQLFGVDWAPMLPEHQHIEARIAPFLRSIYEEFESLRTAPGGKIYGDDPEFFSPYMFFSRPEGPQAISAGSELWNVFTQYFEEYRSMLAKCDLVDGARSEQAQERQNAYDAWHAERDPALKVFARMFGEEWTEEFSSTVLFPGSRVVHHGRRVLAEMDT